MKQQFNSNYYFVFLSISFFLIISFLSACEEVPPDIIFEETVGDTSSVEQVDFEEIRKDTSFLKTTLPDAQLQSVVIEEFSGVRCVNCPEGHRQSEAILEAFPQQAIVFTIHAGFLAAPYDFSKEDYVIDAGRDLYDFLEAEAVPAASINRIKFEGEQTIALLLPSTWAGKVSGEFDKIPPLNLHLYKDFDETSRKLDVYVQLQYLENQSVSQSVSVAITESHIIDAQLNILDNGEEEVTADYEHNHVLRQMITPATGQILGETTEQGRVIVKRFSTVLPENWNTEHLEIVAFVHQNGSDKRVLQGAKLKFK